MWDVTFTEVGFQILQEIPEWLFVDKLESLGKYLSLLHYIKSNIKPIHIVLQNNELDDVVHQPRLCKDRRQRHKIVVEGLLAKV